MYSKISDRSKLFRQSFLEKHWYIATNFTSVNKICLFSTPSMIDDTLVGLQYQQCISVSCTVNNNIHLSSFVYGNETYIRRRGIQDFFMSILDLQPFWLMLGDINTILGSHETMGLSRSTISIDEFGAMISFCKFSKIDTKRVYYTYFKGSISHIMSCLDCWLCFESFLDSWPNFLVAPSRDITSIITHYYYKLTYYA